MSSMASTGADRGHGQWAPVCPRAAPHLLQTLQPAPGSGDSQGCPPGEMGRCLEPASWAVIDQGGWVQGERSCLPRWSSEGISFLLSPHSHAFCGSCPGPFHFSSLFHSHLFAHLPHPDINECEEDGIECGPSQMCFNTRGSYQCVDTPCPATYRQGSSPG